MMIIVFYYNELSLNANEIGMSIKTARHREREYTFVLYIIRCARSHREYIARRTTQTKNGIAMRFSHFENCRTETKITSREEKIQS